MTGYKHGSYSELGNSVAKSAIQSSTVALYVGVAPVHLIQGYAEAEIVNLPVKVQNFTDAQKKLGYSEDWDKYTLCEAMAAHFDNGIQNIGPIYCINVLDPDKHRKSEPTTVSVTFTNNVAEIKTDTAIIDTVAIVNYVKDKDYTVDYDFNTGKVIISKINNEISNQINVGYYEIDLANVDETTIIGGTTANGETTGFAAIKHLYLRENQVLNLLGCPKYSENPKVYAKMITACTKINGHWNAFFCADIPIKDGSNSVDTFVKARNWRKENGYDSERSEISWPQWQDAKTKRIYHISTLNIVNYMIADEDHDGIPMKNASNMQLPTGKQYFGDNSKNQGFDQDEATSELNSYGISTGVFWGGQCVTWDGNTANYQYGKDIDVRGIDCHYMRMLFFVMNGFQTRHASQIDGNFDRHLKDSILDEEQENIDTYISKGGLLQGSKILFLSTENPTSDMINGDWHFDLPITVTPRAKSLTGKVYYTDEALTSLVEEVA